MFIDIFVKLPDFWSRKENAAFGVSTPYAHAHSHPLAARLAGYPRGLKAYFTVWLSGILHCLEALFQDLLLMT